MTGRFNILANTAFTIPNKAPNTIATAKEMKALWVEFHNIPATEAHIKEAGPSDISNDPLE